MWNPQCTICYVTIQILILLLCSNVIKFVPVPRYPWDLFSDYKLGMENFIINHSMHTAIRFDTEKLNILNYFPKKRESDSLYG
jgi:hypothetical protein